MKFAVALTLASTAMAGVAIRDATIVTGVITTAGSDIDALKSAADAYTGDKTALVKAADQLVSDLKSGKSKVDASGDLTAEDAINLTGPVGDLSDKGKALADSLGSRKSEVEKAGECKTVQDQISAITSASNDLIDAVVKKVPTAAQSIAKGLADKLTTVLQQAQDNYKDCTDASGGASSTGAASSTGSATGTGSATTGSATGTGSATVAPTGSASATTSCPPTATGTGGVKPTGTNPPVVNGAALYAPAGILAAVAAAFAL